MVAIHDSDTRFLLMNKILQIIIWSSFLVCCHPAMGQEADQYLKNVLAVQRNNQVYLRWTISAGYTCDGTVVERMTETGAFKKVHEIPGVCGSPDQDITYELTDSNPVPNRINTYRLLLGLLGYSSPISVEVVILNEEGYSIQPNPLHDRSEFLFDNPDRIMHEFCLIDASGKLIMTINTREDKIFLHRQMLDAGTYIFKLRRNNELKATGKVVVI